MVQTPKPVMSKWWPISFFIAAIILFIVGGGLVGAWSSSVDNFDYEYYNFDTYNGLYYGGIACFAIAGLCKFVGWILLIVRCTQTQRSRSTAVAYGYQPPNAYAAPATQGPYVAVPLQPTPAPPYGNVQPVQNNPGMPVRYCGSCGAATTTPFCPQCGIKG